MFKKQKSKIIDLLTFGLGGVIFVNTALSDEHDIASFGAFLVILGFLIRNWRKNEQ